MATLPTDVSKDFLDSGMRLITSPSSDSLLKKSEKEKDEKGPDKSSSNK